MNYRNLVAFHEVVRLGSMTRAAQSLKQGQPNLSRAIRQLEEAVGERLMSRSKSGIQLTSKGQEVFQLAAQYVHTTEELHQKLFHASQNLEFKVGASENLVLHKMPAMLHALKKAYGCNFTVVSGTSEQLETALNRLEVEVAFFFHPPKSAALKSKVVNQVEFVLISPREADVRKASELSTLPFIGSRLDDYSRSYFGLKALERLGLKPRLQIQTNSQEAQVRMVEQGMGYSFVPKFMLEGRSDKIQIWPKISAKSNLYAVRKQELTGKKQEIYARMQALIEKI